MMHERYCCVCSEKVVIQTTEWVEVRWLSLATVSSCKVRILGIVGEVNVKGPTYGLDDSVVIVSCSPPFPTMSVFPLSLHVVLGV